MATSELGTGSRFELSLDQRSKLLVQKINAYSKKLNAIYADAKAAERDQSHFPAFRGKYKTLETLYQDFVSSCDQLMEIFILMDREKECPIDEKKRSQVDVWVYECHAIYESVMNPIPRPGDMTIQQDLSTTTFARSRLPKINVPTFYGDELKWPKFKDLFTSLVHDETALTDIEKFQHLIGCLSGEPLRVASALPLSAANYNTAWNALKKAYDSKRILASAYLRRIYRLKPPTQQQMGLTQLRTFLSTVAENFAAITALSIENEADYFKLFMALECLDSTTRQLFEAKHDGEEFPAYKSLIEFIEHRCKTLSLASPATATPERPHTSKERRPMVFATVKEKTSHQPSQTSSKNSCPKCKGDHLLFKCYSFLRLSPSEKMDLVRSLRVCFNCLRAGHAVPECKSNFTCSHCQRKHHSTLHQDSKQTTTIVPLETSALTTVCQSTDPDKEMPSTQLLGAASANQTVLLGTAMALIQDWKGTPHVVRLVIDSGSQFSLITKGCAKRLGLLWSPVSQSIIGIGGTRPPPAKGFVHCRLSPMSNQDNILMTTALVMETITTELPAVNLNPALSACFASLDLADEKFWNSRPVEFLLGSDLFLQILRSAPVVNISNSFGALPTVFGHVVIGVPPQAPTINAATCLSVTSAPLSDEILKQFWEIEDPLPSQASHPDDIICEELFKRHVSRLSNGRYMVALPLRDSQSFPDAKPQAIKRFRNLEAKLEKNHYLRQKYDEFMKEYIELNHMELTSTESAYVIPHHAIFKPDLTVNQEPKIRVVFDASMRTIAGSLNDHLYTGPKLQRDIATILLNFRVHRVVFCTDMVKMFRQILIRPEDRPYQHIIWRFSPEESIQTYALNTITYGLASSPYLAIRVLQQLAEDDGHRYPNAKKVLLEDVYVDDIITGANSLQDALTLKTQLTALLQGGGFAVHKWASNSSEFLRSIDTEIKPNLELSDRDTTTKVLGMLWDAASDNFLFQVTMTPTLTTKRTMLSVIARLFDPLGFLAPIIFHAKTLLQKLWLLSLDWDSQPPLEIIQEWTIFLQELPRVKEIKIPRWVHAVDGRPSLFGFCDASQKGYAAVLYLRIEQSDNIIHTFLIKAKTRLAPVKTISIPRLELCAAHLLIKLLQSVRGFCEEHQIENVSLFSDSTVVLSWLRMNPGSLRTFVSHRVGYILTHSHTQQWHHIPTTANPADVASRGILASHLINHDLWWSGPLWMQQSILQLPAMPPVLCEVPETKSTIRSLINTTNNEWLHQVILNKSSSYNKAIRITAYIIRFINRLKTKKPASTIHQLTTSELDCATNFLIKNIQRYNFATDFNFSTNVSLSSHFKSLAVFLDEHGLLRVGGRLTHAQIPYDSRHPIILPPKSTFTHLLIDHIHTKYFHLSQAAVQTYFQRRYHTSRLRDLIRNRIWRCLRCFRARAKPESPFMADLPLSRVSQGRPFLKVGVDFAGPYLIKISTRRNAPCTKAYLCIFVCMAVKAVHLEVVSSLSTDAFIAALDRFISRRGLPSDIYSDCGLNFVGAARHLRELYQWHLRQQTQDEMTSYAANREITWHFNPPYSPHFGGLWEAAVKVAKAHLRKTLGERPFYFEELTTLFTRIEGIMNSRPLIKPQSQPDSYDYLTPGHFLVGSALNVPPEKDISEASINRLSRWQLIQRATQVFWRRWSNEYIHILQSRSKWTKKTCPIKQDDLVLLQDAHTSPFQWKMGRVTALHPGQDGVVRVATVRTSSGTSQRAVHRLAVLPKSDP